MAIKKKIERTAASSRPKRTPKPTTVAISSASTVPKPKKKTTATKKATTKAPATKKTAATKVTKKTAPKKTATIKKAGTKKAATKTAGNKTSAKGTQKDAPKYEKWVVPLWKNPLGPEAQKKIDKRKEVEKAESWKWSVISARYTIPFMRQLKQEYEDAVANGYYTHIGYEMYRELHQEMYGEAWDKALEKNVNSNSLEARYTADEIKALKKEMQAQKACHGIPHIDTFSMFLFWKEVEKERAKLDAKYKAEDRKKQQQRQKGTVSAISSPVKKAQSTFVNASPVKNIQGAFARSRSKSPEKKKSPAKMLSNDSGYQGDNEQQSVMSRTWELAANAVEAMRSAVNSE